MADGGNLLVDDHAVEVYGRSRAKAFNLSFRHYWRLDFAGVLRVYTMRVAGRVVGYCLMTLTQHPHFSDERWAFQDSLYVAPAHRGRASVRFLRWIDEQLEREKVDAIHRTVMGTPYGRLLHSSGYSALGQGYVRMGGMAC